LILVTLPVGLLQVNCYVLGCESTGQGIVIDPGDKPGAILGALRRHDLKLAAILGTHAHFDHLLACRPLQESTGAPFWLHPGDRPLVAAMQRTCMAWLGYDPGEPPSVDRDLAPGEVLEFGDIKLEVRHTPGHSPDGVTFVDHANRRAIVGDALFAGSVGRTDFPGSDHRVLIDSIRREILSLPDDYAVLSGHGPATTVGAERRDNPFLNETAW
jgi:glyoxylase-like metal-dependent hydrolase (beta-lactamase superfamily II)